MTQPVRVAIVDDHMMVAESLRRALDAEPDIEVVSVAATAASGMGAAVKHKPAVVLMDDCLPDGDGIAVAAKLLSALPSAKVVLLTGHAGVEVVSAALAAGCVGVPEKTAPLERVAPAIRAAVAGDAIISAAHLARLAAANARQTPLTTRELQILQLVASGLSNRAIAARLTLSLHTVRTHVQHVITKLGAHSRLEAVAKAREQGVLRDG